MHAKAITVMVQQTILNTEIKDGMNSVEKGVKRLFDFIGALVGIVLLSPVYVLVYILLKHQGDGPVIYRQERIGYGGKPFHILKFRTMEVDSEDNGTPQLAQKDDERLTPVGKFLREHHLDELPQLVNVLRGEMSFVGPRPERKYFIDQIMEMNSDYQYIYLMRPGTTSMATLYNGYTDTMEKMLIRLQMDLDYLQKRSLWLDAKVLFTTAEFILFGKKF
jgi:lipopolysaccharide/colanic/teichoic acid biosynthesis glycosyltransferase